MEKTLKIKEIDGKIKLVELPRDYPDEDYRNLNVKIPVNIYTQLKAIRLIEKRTTGLTLPDMATEAFSFYLKLYNKKINKKQGE